MIERMLPSHGFMDKYDLILYKKYKNNILGHYMLISSLLCVALKGIFATGITPAAKNAIKALKTQPINCRRGSNEAQGERVMQDASLVSLSFNQVFKLIHSPDGLFHMPCFPCWRSPGCHCARGTESIFLV